MQGRGGDTDSDADQTTKIILAPTLSGRNADLSTSELEEDDSEKHPYQANFNDTMGEAPDYRRMAEQRNAMDIFECYLDLFETMIEMEPKLFKDAVRTIKKHRTFKFDIHKMKAMKRLYPDLVPNVFTRLWKKEYEPLELKHRLAIFKDAKFAWRNRLRDQGRLDTEAELEEMKLHFHASETMTQIDASMPYLSPINITSDSPKNSQPVTERRKSPESAKKQKKKGGKILNSTITNTDNLNLDSVTLLEPASKNTTQTQAYK